MNHRKSIEVKNNVNKNLLCRIYGEMFTVHIYIDSNDENLIKNTFTFVVCERTTIHNILKLCYEIAFPNKKLNLNKEIHILWKDNNSMGFDKIRTPECKNTLTMEWLKFYYDDIYTKSNHVFLKIFNK